MTYNPRLTSEQMGCYIGYTVLKTCIVDNLDCTDCCCNPYCCRQSSLQRSRNCSNMCYLDFQIAMLFETGTLEHGTLSNCFRRGLSMFRMLDHSLRKNRRRHRHLFARWFQKSTMDIYLHILPGRSLSTMETCTTFCSNCIPHCLHAQSPRCIHRTCLLHARTTDNLLVSLRRTDDVEDCTCRCQGGFGATHRNRCTLLGNIHHHCRNLRLDCR